MKNRRLLAIAIPMVLFVALLATPVPAHAAGWFNLVPNPIDVLLDLALSLVTAVNALLGQLLNLAKTALQWSLSLSLELVLGLGVIDVAWNVMRDMMNFVFIMMLILISFSTIFNVVKGLQRFHYRQALMPVIIAALMMNFSLAIGKAGVLAFDQVTRIFINIMPNLGADLTATLKPQAIVLKPEALVGTLPLGRNTAFVATKDLTAAEDKRYKECLNEKKTVESGAGDESSTLWIIKTVFRAGARNSILGLGGLSERAFTDQVRKSIGDCQQEIIGARHASLKVTAGQDPTPADQASFEKLQASASANALEEKIFLIFSGILSAMLLFLLTCCLVAPFLFILLRVLMLWILLFSSPVAWAGYAIPGTDIFKKWWSLFIGWNAFGPAYLFVLIPGMIVLQSSGELLTALSKSSAAGTTLGTLSGLFQIFMFNAFAVLIFLGGLGVAMKSSFAGAVKGTAFLGDVAGKIGAFDSTGLGSARLAGRAAGKGLSAAGRFTGASAYLEAGAERARQAAGDLRRRYVPQMPFKSYDERRAAARARLGVIGGAEEAAKLRAAPIEEERKRIASGMYGMNKEAKATYLKARMNSADKRVALAAREEMLKMGLLSDQEKTNTANMYGAVGSPARKAFDDRARTAAGAAIREKKKEEAEERESITAQFSARDFPDEASVAAALEGYAPGTPQYKAAVDGIATKAPRQLFQHLLTAGGATPIQSLMKAYGPILKDPKKILDLPPEYLASGTAESIQLKSAIKELYGPPAAPGAERNKRRDDARNKLSDSAPEMGEEIKKLFS